MPKSTAALASHEELRVLFEVLDLWTKIQSGFLSSVEATQKTAPAKTYPDGTSQIVKHYRADGIQACTTHRIVGPGGEILHWDEADIKLGNVTIAKSAERRQGNRA